MNITKYFCAAVFILVTLSAGSETLNYPVDNPVFSIMFPEGWKMDFKDGIVHACPADGSLYLGLWDMPQDFDFEDAGTAVSGIVEDIIDRPEFNPPEPREYNGFSFLSMNGAGFEKHSSMPVNLTVMFFTPDNLSFYMLIYFGSPDAEMKHTGQLSDILESITVIPAA